MIFSFDYKTTLISGTILKDFTERLNDITGGEEGEDYEFGRLGV
ncbi:MAG: hypothetical protein AAF798_00875 [Bacteroidota bacterium]